MTTHHFEPDHYFNTIGPQEPVYYIEPGDRVVTTTVDARGGDSAGNPVTSGSNPMTGPFYINGAEPGDVLVLRLERITPNRATGWSSTGVDPGLVDPWFVHQLPMPESDQPRQLAVWDIDVSAGTVTLRDPAPSGVPDGVPSGVVSGAPSSAGRLDRLALPLDPMLGCFGVAPAGGQSISTATSGPYGGNMDYRGFRAGTTVYLPVFASGALLYLGDGHALQSDGEIAGTGVEVSMNVEVRVDLVKNKTIYWPRGENAVEIFTAGNARPLTQALQHATSEMLRWLKEDYGLDALSAGLLAGQVVSYEVGNVFDPAYTMVCKIKKDVLKQIR